MCKFLSAITAILLIIGGLNWGLVGLWNFDLVATIFGAGSTYARIIYGLVGLSAVYRAIVWYKGCCCGACSR